MTDKKPRSSVDPQMDGRRRTARGEETRRAIVEAAILCLNNFGYAGTSVEAVMEQANLSRGSVLNQFPTRIALMTATISSAAQAMLADTRQRAAAIDDPVDRVRGICTVFWETMQLPASTALTEVLLAARWDSALAEAMRPVAIQIETEIDLYTIELSKAAGIGEAFVQTNRVHARILILSLRGITLELMYDPDRDVIQKALEQIKLMHQAHCDMLLGSR